MRLSKIDFRCQFAWRWKNLTWCLLLVAVMATAGCYSRPTAPSLDYDADAVESLRRQIDAIDWDA